MPIDSKLRAWLKTNKMWIKKNSDKEKTHNVMEYGCFLSVRSDLSDEFIKKLAKTLDNNKQNFLLEIRTDYFKFMVDVDFKSEFGLTNQEKELLMSMIQEAINEVVGDQIEENNLIISSCNDEKIIYNDQEMIKIGFHLIWPNLIVGIDEARYLRSAIIQKLNYSNITLSFGDWEDIIDNSIYDDKHALRMNGSSKNIKCPKCKGKRTLRNECIYCKQTGWFNAGRIYKPTLIFDKKCNKIEDLLQELNMDTYKNLKFTSIRTNSTESNIITTKYIPEWFSENIYTLHNNRRGSKKIKKQSMNPLNKKYKNKEDICENDPRYISLKLFLQSQLYKLSIEFKDIEFNKLLKITTGIKYKKHYFLFSTRNHYCLNMNREHSSNHIFFIINGGKSRSIFQKCHSPYKNNDGILCEEFKSDSIPLNNKLYKILFEENEEKIIVKSKSPKFMFSLDD